MTLPEFENTPGHLIRRAAQVHKALWAEHVTEELTSPQYAVLVALAHESSMGQSALGEKVSLDRSTTADVVARLNRRGLIERVRDPADGRRKVLAITEPGRTAMLRAEPGVLTVRRHLLEGLTTDEGRQLTALLEKLVGHYRDGA